jgi:hypothetical protein
MGEAMAAGAVTAEGLNGIPFDELHRMTVDEYERLAESFGEDLLTPAVSLSSSRLFGEGLLTPAVVRP